MRRLHRRIVPLALVAGLALGPATAASAVGWLPTQSVPLLASDIAVDGKGSAVIVGRNGTTQVQASTRAVGGTWTAPVVVSTADDSSVQKPQVSVDARGNAVAVWSAYSAELSKRVVRVANRPAGGVWSVPFRVSQNEAFIGPAYSIATDQQGATTVAWTELESEHSSTYVLRVVSRPAGGSWATAIPATLTTSGDGSVYWPDVAVNDRGAATVAWVGSKPGPGGAALVDVVRARSRDQSWGAWSAAAELSPGALVWDSPRVTVDGDGDSTVVWSQKDPSSIVRAIRRTAEGNWGAKRDVGAGLEPQIAVAPDGTRTVVWVGPALGGSEVRASHDTGNGTWSPAATLASAESATDLRHPHVGVDRRGDVTAIWGRFDGSSATAEVTRRIGNRPWSDEPDLPVGNLGDYPVGAIDPLGNVTLVWSTPTTTPAASSVFDPVAPDLANVTVPAGAVTGQAIEVVADPVDASPVTVAWDFGDGHTATGPSATHSYATAGSRTVTITATDAVGNVAQTTRPITIVPPADKGFPPPPDTGPGPKTDPEPTITAPVLSGLQQTSVRWTTAKRRGSRVPVGTSFRFRLDRAAKVRLSFEQLVPGRRSGKSCVKATKANRTKRACDRVEQRGTVDAFGKAGANGVDFRGKIGRRTLKPGRYRVRVTATADGKTSKALTKTFTIVR